jgi:hypothetical protein
MNLTEPYDIDAEQRVIAHLIRQPDLVDKVKIEPDAFYSKELRSIYKAIVTLKSESKPIDIPTLVRIASEYEYKATLIETIAKFETPEGFGSYLSILNDCLAKRRLVALLNQTAQMIEDGKTQASKIMEIIGEKLDQIRSIDNSPRNISIKCLKVKQATAPFYQFEVSGQGKKATITLRSGEVLKKGCWLKAITDSLHFIPILGKNFFDIVSSEISKAVAEEAPEEAQEDKYLLRITRDLINGGFEAEDPVDFEGRGLPGYITRSDYRWFKGDTICEALKMKVKLDKGEIWNILSNVGAQKKLIRFKGKVCWLWGMPLSFFKVEGQTEQELTLDDIMESL